MVTLPPELLEAPELAMYEEQIKVRLEEEGLLRNKFRDQLSAGLKAEFINGEVIAHSPSTTRHTLARMNLSQLLTTFVRIHQLGLVLDEKALVSLTRNDYEPDVLFYGLDKARRIETGSTTFSRAGLHCGSSLGHHSPARPGRQIPRLRRHGVPEYWLVDPQADTVEQYELSTAGYVLRIKSGSGSVRRLAVKDFEIPVRSIFDAEENLRVLRQMII